MKSFIKIILAVIIGILITGIIWFVFIMAIVGAAISFNSKDIKLKAPSILNIDLSKETISEKGEDGSAFSIVQNIHNESISLWDAVQAINKAATDDNINMILLKPDMSRTNISISEELRTALNNFRKSGKPIISYIERPDTKSYYMASVADKILMCNNIGAGPMIVGIGSRLIFLKDILDKFGVSLQLIRHGKYKSAGEMFVKNSPSNENVEQTQVLIKSIWNSISEDISKSRNIPMNRISEIIDSLKLNFPSDMLRENLVDKLVNRDTIQKAINVYVGLDDPKDLNYVSLSAYSNYVNKENKINANKIAIIYAEGNIIDGDNKEQVAGDRYADIIAKVRADSSVKAVVLRVASPGGSVLASDKIKAELNLLKKVKPLIASYGITAASGGYWISNNADKIFSDKTTITGSIGVFSMIPDFSKTAKDFLKINVVEIGSSRHSNMYGALKKLDASEINYLQNSVNRIYDSFVNTVAEGRKMRKSYIDSIAQGRVWSGQDAIKINLVDEIGTLEDAVHFAIQNTGIDNDLKDWNIVSYPEPKSKIEALLNNLGLSMEAKILDKTPFEYMIKPINEWKSYKNTKVYARMPYEIELY